MLFNPITFIFSKDSNYGQNIAGCCQQTFENKKFVDNTQQYFAFMSFRPIIWINTEGEGDGIKSVLSS